VGDRHSKVSRPKIVRLGSSQTSGLFLAMRADHSSNSPEHIRLQEDHARTRNWQRWGPYLSERQWATVREDYSPNGTCWDFFPHDHARSRAYRWGEDGLLGFTDRECRLCFALALWNGRDPILKERLFGLTGPEGNHGEDVKESYFYLDSTPTHSYAKALYKYPQSEFPYAKLAAENRVRGLQAREYELQDTGAFDESRYFDVMAEYAKASPDDILIRITVTNRGPQNAVLHLLPTLWFRNTWSWDDTGESPSVKPSMRLERDGVVTAFHEELDEFRFAYEGNATPLFTENETNTKRLWGVTSGGRFFKDAFHEAVVQGRVQAVNGDLRGTKFAPHYTLDLGPGESTVVRLRLSASSSFQPDQFGSFDGIFAERIREADEFYRKVIPAGLDVESRAVARQGYAGLLWSKQFYYYVVRDWLAGDAGQVSPPGERHAGRNHEWRHLYSRDVVSMPDKWEYPWFAAWDLAFHMIPMAQVDPEFAKHQITLFLREWYMHPNGQIPAYEFALGDVNPPVHAWAAWRIYKMTGERGTRDRVFLESVFQKLLLNFTWWVNRKDVEGNNIFSGGFLGLDNIGVFDRSQPLPTGGYLQQADGTAWMGFYCLTMLSMALELAQENPIYEDMASKFFEHFVGITDALNTIGGTGLWDEEEGFYYDQLKANGQMLPLRTRSLVGLLPLIAVEVLETDQLKRLPGFVKRMNWFLDHRPDLADVISFCEACPNDQHRILALSSEKRLRRALRYMLDEAEFLSPHGLRSVSKYHRDHPYIFRGAGQEHRVDYVPGEGTSYLFGGNSNWRGPVWFPINYLIVEALERYHHFYGDQLQVEFPTGSGIKMNLQQVARELSSRLTGIFLPDEQGRRPFHGDDPRFASDPHWRDLVLFHEYFHGDTGRGLGASHQTGWTALAVKLLENRMQTGGGGSRLRQL
jgi:hypothetical protein